jgi:hypothetical protein
MWYLARAFPVGLRVASVCCFPELGGLIGLVRKDGQGWVFLLFGCQVMTDSYTSNWSIMDAYQRAFGWGWFV